MSLEYLQLNNMQIFTFGNFRIFFLPEQYLSI